MILLTMCQLHMSTKQVLINESSPIPIRTDIQRKLDKTLNSSIRIYKLIYVVLKLFFQLFVFKCATWESFDVLLS
jgi:hypothetical protein